MTKTEELINEVLKLDAEATKGDWYWYATSPSTPCVLSKVGSRSEIVSSGSYNTDAELIAAYRTAAPILARMLKRAIEQRDGIYKIFLASFDRLGVGTDSIKEFASLEVANTELDRIVAEGLGEK